MHVVNLDNYEEAQDAIRDILLMYVFMAESYQGFGHAVDIVIRFDPLKFVDCELDDRDGWLVDLDLLRTGSAMVILCRLYDLWSEELTLDHPSLRPVVEAIEGGRLKFAPDVEAVAREALRRNSMPLEDPWFDEAVAPIYRRRVLGYFKHLASMERPS